MTDVAPQPRRPAHVVARDQSVAVLLLQGQRSLAGIVETLGGETKSDDVYRSLWRLRQQNIVTKVATGSRTPDWTLTEGGVGWAQQAQASVSVPVAAPQPEPTPTPEPAPEPEPQPEVPTF